MNLRNKIGQLMLMGIQGKTLSLDEKKFIVANGIGGIVLFSRNIESPEQVHHLCSEIQSLSKSQTAKAPLFIGIDMEGGRVARLKSPFTVWPPLKKVGDLDSPAVAFQMAWCMGKELKAVGINMDFAPCLDVFTNHENKVIGDRSASTDPEQVAKIGSAQVRGFIKAGVISCVKHFPGHGNTLLDSHEALPIEDSDLERLEKVELVPFKKVFKSKADLVMSAHIRFPKIDPDWPATLSEVFLKTILREKLRYKGMIITDDLDMKALANNYSKAEIPVRALQAGADLLLYCNEPESPVIALEAIEASVGSGRLLAEGIEQTFKRVLDFKKEHLNNIDPIPWAQAREVIGHPDHFKIAQAIQNGVVPEGVSFS